MDLNTALKIIQFIEYRVDDITIIRDKRSHLVEVTACHPKTTCQVSYKASSFLEAIKLAMQDHGGSWSW